MIKRFDIDKMDELQDEMLNMKMQTDMMNQIMTEGYDMDDEDE